MKLFKRYFGPYAEYTLQFALAKDVLQAALLTGITAALSGYWWQSLAALAMIGFLFLILEICRAFATDEIPQICRDLNTFLHKLEQKYSGEKQ